MVDDGKRHHSVGACALAEPRAFGLTPPLIRARVGEIADKGREACVDVAGSAKRNVDRRRVTIPADGSLGAGLQCEQRVFAGVAADVPQHSRFDQVRERRYLAALRLLLFGGIAAGRDVVVPQAAARFWSELCEPGAHVAKHVKEARARKRGSGGRLTRMGCRRPRRLQCGEQHLHLLQWAAEEYFFGKQNRVIPG